MAPLDLKNMTGYGLPSMPRIGINSLYSTSAIPVPRSYDFGEQINYTPDQLKWSDGKLMAGDVAVDQWDTVGGKPIGSYSTIEQILDKNHFSQLLPYSFGKNLLEKNPQLVDYYKSKGTENPYSKDFDKFKWFASDPESRALLYGAYGEVGKNNFLDNQLGGYLGFNDDSGLPGSWDYEDIVGRNVSLGGGKGGRGDMTINRSKKLMQAMDTIFKDKPIWEQDKAAYNALKKWSANRGGDTYHYGENANDVVRAIGAELGGLPPSVLEYLKSTDEQEAARGRSNVSAAHAADDAASGGLGGLSGLLGAAASFALGPAGFSIMPAWGAGAVGGALGSALGGGNPLQGALLGGIGGGFGGEVTGMLGDAAGLNFLSGDFVGPLSFGESLAKSAITGGIGGLARGITTGNPFMGALQGTVTGGAGSVMSGLNATGNHGLDTAIERGLVNAGGAGLFGGNVDDALMGSAVNAGFAGLGGELGLSPAASGNISSMVSSILRSNISQKQKKAAIEKIQRQRMMQANARRGMMTNAPLRRAV